MGGPRRREASKSAVVVYDHNFRRIRDESRPGSTCPAMEVENNIRTAGRRIESLIFILPQIPSTFSRCEILSAEKD